MTLNRMIDADKICANLLFLRNQRPAYKTPVRSWIIRFSRTTQPG